MIGESSTEADVEVNPCKSKELTNFRNTGSEEQVRLRPPRTFALEEAIAYVESDELLEVTPAVIRMRKAELDTNKRRALARNKAKQY